MRCRVLMAGACILACRSPAVFPCNADEDCAGGAGGVCTEGYCAFPDVDCESGLRFGEFAAPDLAGKCVAPSGTATDDPSSGDASTGSPSSTSLTTTASTTTDATSTTTMAVEESSTSTGNACPPGWWDCAWSRRRRIDLVAPIGTGVVDFPALVVLTPQRIDFSVAALDGADVRFVLGDEELAHELVVWDPTSTTELWVRLPALDGAAPLYLYYGNPDATSGADPLGVWSNDYRAVLHMFDATDSLGNFAFESAGIEAAPGLVGHGLQFDAVSSYLRAEGEPTELFTDGTTVSAVFQANGFGEGGFGRILDGSDTNTTATGWSVGVAMEGDGGLESIRFSRGYKPNRGIWYSADQSVALDTWVVAAVAYRDGLKETPSFFIGGQPSPTVTEATPSGTLAPSPLPVTVGALATTALRFFDGTIDEIHVAGPRTPEWIAVEQLSFTDQLLAFGGEDSR